LPVCSSPSPFTDWSPSRSFSRLGAWPSSRRHWPPLQRYPRPFSLLLALARHGGRARALQAPLPPLLSPSSALACHLMLLSTSCHTSLAPSPATADAVARPAAANMAASRRRAWPRSHRPPQAMSVPGAGAARRLHSPTPLPRRRRASTGRPFPCSVRKEEGKDLVQKLKQVQGSQVTHMNSAQQCFSFSIFS
jgi:hypothetical protein